MICKRLKRLASLASGYSRCHVLMAPVVPVAEVINSVLRITGSWLEEERGGYVD
jgi:hypothetical protein